ncbi:LysR family transcriptional regulator substrate-binding protein [Secundilactobacillus oryzae]|nr:LysR family transcriptional regulator substrate-binding protein [Secundilactobacillus oryzae]
MQRAEEIISIVDKTTYNLQKQDIISGTLDIGAGESIGLRPVMQTIQQIVRQYPEVHINLKSGDSEDIKAKLDAGTLEFAVIMGHQQLSQYNTLTLPDENQWGALMRKDEQLASHEVITASDLLGRPLIGSGQMMRLATFREWSHNLIDQYNFIGTYNLIFNAKLLVETGAGIALTYKDLVDTTGDTDLIFRPLSPKMSEPNTLIWPKNHSLPNVSQLFLDTLKQNI